MDIREILAKKNELLLTLLALKKATASRTKVRSLANQVAFLEGLLAEHWIEAGKPEIAARNVMSQASCLLDTRRRGEAGRVLRRVLRLGLSEKLNAYIEREFQKPLAEAHSSRIPTAAPRIRGNTKLRKPQVLSYEESLAHFKDSGEPAIIQLPVGCGKTGAMSLAPFGLSSSRVLVLAPNVTIRENLAAKLDYAKPESFWRKTGVFANGAAPVVAELSDGATDQDTDTADVVVANYQRLVGNSDRIEHFAADYFDLILVDEGHHNITGSYRTIFERFPRARRLSYTATPIRADGHPVEGKRIYRFPIADAIREGYVKDLASRRLEPTEITFVYKGEEKKHSLAEVAELREEDWFSRGIALSDECNVSIVDASIQCMRELRERGTERHQIIGVACGVDHAKRVRSLYSERGLHAAVLFNEMDKAEQARVKRELEDGSLDAIVQVMMLGEGADFPRLSVAAIFRPFRHLVPYIQFVGRIMRVLKQDAPGHPDNRGYVVSHVGLNVDRWWKDLRKLDEDDQEFFESMAHGSLDPQSDGDGSSPRRRFTPDMTVLQETIEFFVQERFLTEISEAQVDDLIRTMDLRGLDFAALGVGRDELVNRLTEASAKATSRGTFTAIPVSPQEARKQARLRLNEREKSAASQLVRQLGLSVVGRELSKRRTGAGAQNNLTTAIILVKSKVNESLGISAQERDLLTEEECKKAHDTIDDIVDQLADELKPNDG